ncbi:Na+/H+ antiporter subunit E [Nonomuraea sp. KM88]|uniref:Na+/H+ antiporter subunit E n=1 Tax=Nonomuraea sp. KM88 TaxID=3457427 RepID=UPI003FCECD3D
MNLNVLAPRVFGRRVPLPLVAWLTLVWTALWGDVSAGNLLGGLAAGAVVTWLLPLPAVDPGIRVNPAGLVRFLLWFAAEGVVSTLRVVYWVVHPGPPPTQVVRVRLRTSSESMVVLTMVAITSVPGSLVAELYPEEHEVAVHVLGLPGEVTEAVRADITALERRIVEAFGTRADREELR